MNPLVHTLLPAAVLLSVLPAASQSSNPFAEQVLRYPQEKLHIHTDKDTYVAGDTIWLRARCVDAASHRPVAASRYVYAELRDESGALVRRIKILRRDSLYAGYLPVPTDAPDGDYTFSAYTRFMRNQGADYFFRKPLRIAAYRGAASEVPKPRPRPATGDFAVTFHPEGGYLVPGRSCRVAFKALTDAGRSTAVEAVLRDDRGTTLDTVRTRRAGMGSFRMVPEAGRTYHAVCRTPSGAEKRFDLPVPNAAACVLQLEERDGFIAVNVLTAGSLPARLRLVVHCRGNRCYDGGWEPGLLFRSSDLPAGVVQWLLLDAAGNALSERLLFNEGTEGVHVSLRAENPSPRRRERADFSVRLTDSAGNPLRGEFSVSVTDRNAVPDPVSGDIRTTLLLTSDLRGYVECPGSYFRSDDPEARAALDELMLTQGWRRYDVPALLRGEYAEPEYALEAGQQLRTDRPGRAGEHPQAAREVPDGDDRAPLRLPGRSSGPGGRMLRSRRFRFSRQHGIRAAAADDDRADAQCLREGRSRDFPRERDSGALSGRRGRRCGGAVPHGAGLRRIHGLGRPAERAHRPRGGAGEAGDSPDAGRAQGGLLLGCGADRRYGSPHDPRLHRTDAGNTQAGERVSLSGTGRFLHVRRSALR